MEDFHRRAVAADILKDIAPVGETTRDWLDLLAQIDDADRASKVVEK